MQNNGFIDLRISPGISGQGNDDSVWPSFTDIMTVVVMVFLIALAIMIARNFELDRQLLTSNTEQEASLLQNQGLVKKLSTLENKVFSLEGSLDTSIGERDVLRVQLLAELKRIELLAADQSSLEDQLAAIIEERRRLAEYGRATEEKLVETRQRADDLSSNKVRLTQQVDTLTANEKKLSQKIAAVVQQFRIFELPPAGQFFEIGNRSLSEQLDTIIERIKQAQSFLQTERLQSAQRTAEKDSEIKRLENLIVQRQAQNEELQALADESNIKIRSLEEEYQSIDAKYRSLVRPARNPAGKHVVEVWYSKQDSGYFFRFREPGQNVLIDYSREQLEQQLTYLKKKYGSNLYTKIVIPADSGLSHNEAWIFTQAILQKYDYYAQRPSNTSGGSSETQ